MNAKEIQANLNRLGWNLAVDGDIGPKTRSAIRRFQAGWRLGNILVVDGVVGRATQPAINASLSALAAGRGTASAHFSYSEFRCHCGGRYADCERIVLSGDLLASLERYRSALGKPVSIVSGYRCPSHNRAVGGVGNSQHLYGAAADIPQAMSTNRVADLRTFGAIGYQSGTGLVRHVDRRDISGHNTTGASLSRPTIYPY